MALYEPNARFVEESGEVVPGYAAIREQMKGFLAPKPKFSIKVTSVQSADGNIALTRANWSVSGTDAEGKPVTMSGRSEEVIGVRLTAPGYVIDGPEEI